MATVVLDDLWFCDDCTLAAVLDDYSDIDDDEREATIRRGLRALAEVATVTEGYAYASIVEDVGENDEGVRDLSWSACDCCGIGVGGSRTRFVVLGS